MCAFPQQRPLQAPLLAGFAVRGFRSFHGDVQFIGPLAKVTVIAGPNNSGKSNVSLFASRLSGAFPADGTPTSLELAAMDRPLLPEGVEPPLLTVGVARQTGTQYAIGDLEKVLGIQLDTGHTDTVMLRMVAEALPYGSNETNGGLQWFLWDQVDGTMRPSALQVEPLVQELVRSGQDALFNNKLQGTLGRSNGSDHHANVSMFLQAWAGRLDMPAVVQVPGVRSVVAEGEASSLLESNDGRGLPGHLQTLQSPAAETFREDSARFARINNFLRSVLGDPDVALSVPYTKGTIHLLAGGKVLPLESLGAGLTQLVILSVIATSHSGKLITIDEPEMHLHPTLVRQLVRYLNEDTDNQYLLTTHSAALLDDPSVSVIEVEHVPEQGTVARPAILNQDRARVSHHLGYRPSDLIQANCVIWVEGPSDRVYLNFWLRQASPELVEGVHYSVMSYGGSLISYLTANDIDSPDVGADLVSLVRINRHTAILLDSDLSESDEAPTKTKRRIVGEVQNTGGFVWMTKGRMIENYVPIEAFNAAATGVHPSWTEASPGPFIHRFNEGLVQRPNKTRIAEAATRDVDGSPWDELDLREKVDALVHFVSQANDRVLGSTQSVSATLDE